MTRLRRFPALCVFVLCAGLMLLTAPPRVSAQEAAQQPDAIEDVPISDPLLDEDGKLVPVMDEYMALTIQNLSKMYWAVAMLDIDDNKNIDNYLRINECEMYRKYFHNDFEWADIRRATKEYIVSNLAAFPQKFEVIMPVFLARYDIHSEKFLIEEESKFVGVTRLETGYNKTYMDVCGAEGEIPNYPKNVIINLSLPFTLADVPVKPEVAEFYLAEAKRQFSDLPADLQIKKYQRVVFLRMKVTMMQFKEYLRPHSGPVKAVVFGRVDGYDVFADQDKRLLMYSHSYDGRKITRRRVKKQPVEGATGQEQQAPAPDVPAEGGSLLQPTKPE